MILSTHAIVGAALASFMPGHPVAAALVGFASHFAIDAIPHWDYPLRSQSVRPNNPGAMTYDLALARDLAVIGADALVGTLLAVVLFASPSTNWVILIGAFAAMLPDPLQFVHGRYPREPLRTLQRFHVWIHTARRMKNRIALGVMSQLAFVIAVIVVTVCIHRVMLGAAKTGWGLL
jgi:hypothetical protein